MDRFLGRIFETPDAVIPQEMLRPELQDPAGFAEGIDAICEAQRRVALHYFEDGSVEAACPPVRALLHIMAHGHFEGKDVNDPSIRSMFTREALLDSDWYRERLRVKQTRDIALWRRHLEAWIARGCRRTGAGKRAGLFGESCRNDWRRSVCVADPCTRETVTCFGIRS